MSRYAMLFLLNIYIRYHHPCKFIYFCFLGTFYWLDCSFQHSLEPLFITTTQIKLLSYQAILPLKHLVLSFSKGFEEKRDSNILWRIKNHVRFLFNPCTQIEMYMSVHNNISNHSFYFFKSSQKQEQKLECEHALHTCTVQYCRM